MRGDRFANCGFICKQLILAVIAGSQRRRFSVEGFSQAKEGK
jgi:hypothetical protein